MCASTAALQTLLRDLEALVAATLRVNSTPWWRGSGSALRKFA
jgi:hypothetical protein